MTIEAGTTNDGLRRAARGRGSRIRYTSRMGEATVKQQIRDAIDRLPDDATLEDVAELIRMHEMLARARRERSAGNVYTSDQLRERYGIAREG